jgi:cell division septum initiation protein DivIVA
MDVPKLLDELEAVIEEGWSIPLTKRALVEQETCLYLIDLLRTALPKELAEAQLIKQNKDKILTDARAKAEEIVKLARKQAELILEESQLMEIAKLRSQAIIQQGEQQVAGMVQRARNYADEVYLKLERDLNFLLAEVKDMVAREKHTLTERRRGISKHGIGEEEQTYL